MISRRRFLRNTLVGSALLGTAALVGRHLSGYALDDAVKTRLRALSPKELLVLQAVVRRMVAPDQAGAPTADETEAALYIDGYLARLDPAMRSDCCALLHLVEHGSAFFRLSGSRFTHMSAAEQDATLADWEASRFAVRRRGFQALKTLAFLGYYRSDKTWPMIGYSGPTLPKAPL